MKTRVARIALLLTLVSAALAVKTLNYNIGGPPLGKFCGDPVAFLVSTSSSVEYSDFGKSGSLGALATHRALSAGSDKFEFLFPVSAGEYTIVLGFAEIKTEGFGLGKRLFDFAVQDGVQYQGFDIYNGSGADTALWKTIKDVTVVGNSGLKVSFMKGAALSPIISIIEITRQDGLDIPYPAGSVCKGVKATPPPKCSTGTGATADPTMTGGEDHQAHAVAGEGYLKTDFDGDGQVSVLLDGTRSHSHYFNPTTGESGAIATFTWTVNGKVIGTTAKLQATFPVGKTIVTLTVVDNLNDIACEDTEVIGLPQSDNGAYCYFYPGVDMVNINLNSLPKPLQGVKVQDINWPTLDAFPFLGKNEDMWTVRCTANVKTTALVPGDLQLVRTGRIHLYVDGFTLIDEKLGSGGTGIVPVPFKFAGPTIMLSIVYNKAGPDANLVLQVKGTPVTESELMFSQSDIIPVLSSASPTKLPSVGGGQMQLFGSGFFNQPEVFVGNAKAATTVVSSTELLIIIPSQAAAGSASTTVYVSNNAGQSNSLPVSYETTTCDNPVTWTWTFFKNDQGGKHNIALTTSIAIGPDFFYYFGSQDGFVYKVSVDRELVVTSQCKSASMGKSRSVLGIAFNPKKKQPEPYVTTSTLFRDNSKVNTPLKGTVDGWTNGKVEMLTVGCGCFCPPKEIVSGLPVSLHDHAVNKIVFLPNGDMLLTVAGATNGGHNTPGTIFSDQGETVLSASVLLIKTSKGDDIDGKVTYDQVQVPENAVKVGGTDVSVYATGLRNSFGICRTVKGQIYATDNGANKGIGLKSTSCTTQVDFPSSIKDELSLILPGKFYGHANRAQGNCVWGAGEQSIAEFQSSTDGVIQYQSNVFCGMLKHDIIASQYTTQNPDFQGNTNRVILNPDGTAKSKFIMAQYSGVDVDNGLYGELVMPRVSKFMVAVLKPVYAAPTGPFVVACNPKIGSGSQMIMVTGNNFVPGLTATVGGKMCTNVQVMDQFAFKCVTPPGTGLVSIIVTNPDGSTSPTIEPAGDFSYVE